MYFEGETKKFNDLLEATESESVAGFIPDRTDPDALGWVVLTHRLLRERFNKAFNCFYSKKIAFMMNRNIVKNFVPAGVLHRVEENKDLLAVSGLKTFLKSDEWAQKSILFVDHHERVEKDLEDLPNVTPLRVESSQSTSSMMLHIMRNLDVELNPDEEGDLRTAVACKLGIEIDLIGYDEDKIADSVKDSMAYLDGVIGEKGQALVKKLRQIKIPRRWYPHLSRALAQVPRANQNLAVVGLGVLDDNGILPFVANELMRTGYFESVMVYGIVYDQIGQRFVDIDLEASGRSRNKPDISLPELFSKVFFYRDEQGRKVSRGGGRANEILGDFAGAGASVPLKYFLDMTSFGIDQLKRLLIEHAWPIEFERTKANLLSAHDVKPDQIHDVAERPEDRAEPAED